MLAAWFLKVLSRMEKIMKYQYLMLIALLAVSGYSELVVAHEVAGALGAKKSTASASDIYQVTCPSPTTTQLVISVKNLTPTRPRFRKPGQKYWNGALVSIQAVDTISQAASSVVTDRKGGTAKCRKFSDGGDSCFTEEIALQAGQGPYQLIVTKSASNKRGAVIYHADAHCLDVSGNHSDNEVIDMIQNQ
jgi:hypothetical protein